MSQQLVTPVQTLAAPLANRFENLVHVNTGQGVLSLVFRAFDRLTKKPVAVKFFDIDPDPNKQNPYRIDGFERESKLLEQLKGENRCLQLVHPLTTVDIPMQPLMPAGMTWPCRYFVTDYLQEDIKGIFDTQDKQPALEKLELFHECVLAVQALHQRDIFHRDLKPDNFRGDVPGAKRKIQAIDLGTAARSNSPFMAHPYPAPVGAQAWAAPEGFGGLAIHRAVAPMTDMYALGCMLWELFNPGLFFQELQKRNPNYGVHMMTLLHAIAPIPALDAKVAMWKTTAARTAKGIAPVTIDPTGTSVPKAVVPVLNDLLARMTAFDFTRREADLASVTRSLQIAMKILRNEKEAERRLKLARERRAKKIAKIKALEQKLKQRAIQC
jgi:serine/threonine protein kinase